MLSKRDPSSIKHPMCKKSNWMIYDIPIRGNADPAVGVGKSDSTSFDTYSLQICFTFGPTVLVKLCCVFGDCKTKATPRNVDGTMKGCWKVLVRVSKASFSVKWHMTNYDGSP